MAPELRMQAFLGVLPQTLKGREHKALLVIAIEQGLEALLRESTRDFKRFTLSLLKDKVLSAICNNN